MTTDSRSGAAALVDALERNGVDVVFGIPGVHNLEIYRHLARSSIEHVAVRHEQGAGYAADGYARAGGRPGVCVTTSGPGLTNTCTAVATAYADSIPVLVCSPGPPIGQERLDLGLLHEMKDQHAHFETLAAVSVRPSSAAEIEDAVDEIFDGWRRARPRPVHLDIPVDVLEADWPLRDGGSTGSAAAVRSAFDQMAPGRGGPVDAGELDRAARLLASARRPVVVLGGGSRHAPREVRELVERLGAPVVTTVNGKGSLPEDHALSLGASLRLMGTRPIVESADVLVVVGSELGDSDMWGSPLRAGGEVVRIDIDPHQMEKNLPASVAICADAGEALSRLLERVDHGDVPLSWGASCEVLRAQLRAEAIVDGAKYETVNRRLSELLPARTIVAGDSAQVSYFGTAHFWPMQRAGQFLYPTGFSTLGYGLPAAVGAKMACPGDPVVALVGDGGTLFTIQEMITAVERHLAIPVVVVDNHGYAEIREGMEERGIPPVAVDRPPVDFAALGAALGGFGALATDVDDLCELTERALEKKAPTLISIDIALGAVR